MPFPLRGADRVQPVAGYDHIEEIQRELDKLRDQMAESVDTFAKARATQSFASDRKKDALSNAVVALHQSNPEDSNAALEHKARASTLYKTTVAQLYKDEVLSESIIANWRIMENRLDVLRSYLSIENAKLKLL